MSNNVNKSINNQRAVRFMNSKTFYFKYNFLNMILETVFFQINTFYLCLTAENCSRYADCIFIQCLFTYVIPIFTSFGADMIEVQAMYKMYLENKSYKRQNH
jgi:hypothetical protein